MRLREQNVFFDFNYYDKRKAFDCLSLRAGGITWQKYCGCQNNHTKRVVHITVLPDREAPSNKKKFVYYHKTYYQSHNYVKYTTGFDQTGY